MTIAPLLADERPSPPAAGMWRAALRHPLAVIALGYFVVVIVAAVAAPLLAPYDATTVDLDHVLSAPTMAHPWGTDSLGRDVLSRLMYGGRITLSGVAEAVLTVLVLGVTTGLTAGYLGGRTDRVISWVIEVMLAIPVIVTLLGVLAVVGSNETAAMIAFGVLAAPGLARVVRAATLAVRQELYVAAARVAGLSVPRVIVGQVLPRVVRPVIVQTSLLAGAALLTETGLGYLGLGVQPPTPTWGGMVADASNVIDQQPWLLIPPGVIIGLAILAFGLLGDAVRDATADRTSRRVTRMTRRAVPTTSRGGQLDRAAAKQEPGTLLSLSRLAVSLPTERGVSTVVEGIDLVIRPGQTVGLVGESGCGKSITAAAILGLLPPGGQVSDGHIVFGGSDLTTLTRHEWRGVRGKRIGLVSQEPIGSLDPLFPVGRQVGELVRRHHGGTRRAVRARSLELLRSVHLPDPEAVARRHPHELSGGMAQRVAIAMALAGEPELLIADEPTTALDVTVQAEILRLLRGLQQETGMAILLISHDWGVVAELCQRAYVMYAGHVVESATVAELVNQPRHPYTAALLDCAPHRNAPRTALPAINGVVPAPGRWPAGCHFHPRCRLASPDCAESIPMFEPEAGHLTRCLHHGDMVKEDGHDRAGAPSGSV